MSQNVDDLWFIRVTEPVPLLKEVGGAPTGTVGGRVGQAEAGWQDRAAWVAIAGWCVISGESWTSVAAPAAAVAAWVGRAALAEILLFVGAPIAAVPWILVARWPTVVTGSAAVVGAAVALARAPAFTWPDPAASAVLVLFALWRRAPVSPRSSDAAIPVAETRAGGWVASGAVPPELVAAASGEVRDASGRVWVVQRDAHWASFADVSAYVDQIERLRADVAGWRSVLEELPVAALWEDQRAATVHNRAWSEVLGLGASDVGFYAAFVDPLLARVGGLVSGDLGTRIAAIRRGTQAVSGLEIFLHDGRVLELDTRPVVSGRVWVLRDGTAIREEQRRQAEFLRMVLESIGHPVWVKNHALELVGCNEAYLSLRGLPRLVALGRRERDLCDDAWAREEEARDQEVLDTGVSQSWADDRVVLGRHQHLLTRRFPTAGVDGRGVVVAVAVDLTPQRELERQLRSARQAAEAAVEARSRFMANMTHELRTPMVGVLGMVDVLLNTELDDEQRSFARTIQSSGLAQLDIINDILDYSKIEAGKMLVDPCPLHLRGALHDVVDQLAPRAQEKGIELVVDVDAQVPEAVLLDPNRLRQILLNLVGNATKFSETGHVVVDVSRQVDELLFRVVDTGIGIPEEAIARLFTAFTQAESGTTRRFGGTGLGLAISRSLVELMGGRIGVDSRPGWGSTFWFTLPLRPAVSTAEPLVVPPDVRDRGCVVALDDWAARRALLSALEALGVTARGAESATELERAVEVHRPALVVFDPALSLGEGLGLVRTIRAERRDVRVVAAAPWSLLAELRRAVGSAIDEVIPRPVRIEALLKAAAPAERTRRRSEGAALPAFQAHVLLVEDNPVNQRVAALILGRFGIVPDVADNGRIGVAMAMNTAYDLVLMDCQMPVMDGYQATQQIRAVSERRVPICALTANAGDGDRDRCLAAGMDDFLAKPFRPEQLLAILERWLATPGELVSTH